ncbi:nSTAND1 domain-containing NTPase [Leucobacter celer]|uniref:nSTAND1 domain-containing NTPase n=1 Tax=Leucobacter celer TaxID=668625 RepID=UPI0006A7A9C2|nr:hypothetical protein [Leucobacter celer]
MPEPHPADELGRISSRQDLARGLTALREEARKTIRELSLETGVPSATIGGYCSGRHLPALTHLDPFLSVLGALGVQRTGPWVEAVKRVRWAGHPRSVDEAAPYRGLESYDVGDARWFFGRGQPTEEVLALVRKRKDTGGVIAVVGASGSGKSSLLRAGVLAAVERGELGDGWWGGVMTPGDAPITLLEATLAGAPADGRVVLVVDQLEELFAEEIGLHERDEFVRRLIELGESCIVVLGMRADFYGAATRVSGLIPFLQHAQIVLGPMGEEDLRSAIVEPSRVAGADLDPELVTRVVGDIAPSRSASRAHDTGMLPLLSHAMRTTWEAAAGASPTVAHYELIGGVFGAITRSADEVYDGLSDDAQNLAQQIFLRLLRDDGDLLTRRRVLWDDLIDPDREDPLATEVIEAFIAARLLTVDAETVTVAHEALLASWPRIGEWIEADRAGMRLRRQIGEAALAWEESGRDPGALWRGARLELAGDLAAEPRRGGLSRLERAFVSTAIEAADSEVRLARRRSRRLKQLLGAVAVLAAVAVVLAGFAITGQNGAREARDEALSRQIAIQANLLADTDPALAQQLAVAGHRIFPSVEARSAMLDIDSGIAVTRFAVPIGPASVSASADGGLIATGNVDGSLRLFAQADGSVQQIGEAEIDPDHPMYGVALTPDGSLAAIGGTADVVRLVDTKDPARPVLLPQRLQAGGIEAMAFSPDGRLLVGSSRFETAHRWRIDDGGIATELGALTGFGGPLHVSAFSSDGGLLATASNDGVLRVWDAAHPAATDTPSASFDLGAASNHVLGVSFSPDGTLLAASTRDGRLRLFEVGESSLTPRGAPFGDFAAQVNAVAFHPSGAEIVAGGSDATVRVFDALTRVEIDRMSNTTPITSLSYLDDSREVLVGAPDGYVRVWRRADSVPPVTVMPGADIALDAAGRLLAVGVRTATEGEVMLWDTSEPYRPSLLAAGVDVEGSQLNGTIAMREDGSLLAAGTVSGEVRLLSLNAAGSHPVATLNASDTTVQHLAFDTTGSLLAVATDDATLSLWNVTDPSVPELIDDLHDAADRLLGAAFDRSGTLLAASSADTRVYVYRVDAEAGLEALAVIDEPENFVHTVAFSPEDAILAVGSADRRIRLYDLSDPQRPAQLGSALRGPTGYVLEVSFAADGAHLAAVADGVAWVWGIQQPDRPELLGALRASDGGLSAVRISPIDDAILAVGGDARLLSWDPHPSRVEKRLCALSGTSITAEEWEQYVPGADYAPPCADA